MEVINMNRSTKFPKIEKNSFYSPYASETTDRRRSTMEKRRQEQEFTTFYFDYVYDNDGNCKIIPRPYEDEV